MATKYTIKVDRDLCIGAASCVALAPKTFELDSEGKAIVLDPINDNDADILAAAESCPTKAIFLEEGGQQVFPR